MQLENRFTSLVSDIQGIGKEWHENTLIENAISNRPFFDKSIRELPDNLPSEKQASAIIVSAGPSLHKFDVLKKIKDSDYKGSIVAVDGSMIKCLKNGIVPDYVLTLDPHHKRIVRWFGDPNFEENSRNDDYFRRQDLDIEFRKDTINENQRNIELINRYGHEIKLIICTSAPPNVTARAVEAEFDRYWWNPLVDNPTDESSITRRLYDINPIKCMNTGGTVGTAAWVFANSVLNIPNIAVTGMDLGYHMETPIELTQTYYELQEYVQSREELESLFPKFTYPTTGEVYYTDPTYYWYCENILGLIRQSSGKTYNCSEAGILFNDDLTCIGLNDFLEMHRNG